METRLEQILTHAYKAEMIANLTAHDEDFYEVIVLYNILTGSFVNILQYFGFSESELIFLNP